jgi:hypothetical protein
MPNPAKQQRCFGKAFLSETELEYGNQNWYNPINLHGTHVAGYVSFRPVGMHVVAVRSA